MRRRELLLALGGAIALQKTARSQQMPVIGWLSPLRSDQPLPQRDIVAFVVRDPR